MREEPLPYFNERETPIDMIVLHCSAYDVETIIHYMHEYQLSAHYIIDEKGEMTKLVDESKRAYHAGTGFWRGEDRSRTPAPSALNWSISASDKKPTLRNKLTRCSTFCHPSSANIISARK